MTPYRRRRAEFSGWWAVWKTRARSMIDIPCQSDPATESSLEVCYQEDEMPVNPNVSSVDHPLDNATHLTQNIEKEEEVLPIDFPPPALRPGQLTVIEADESEEEEDDFESESNDDNEDEFEFCSGESESEDEEEDKEEDEEEEE